MSKICMQLDKNFVVSEDFINNLLLKKDFFVDEISLFFDLEFLETDTSSDFSRIKEEIQEVHYILKEREVALNLLLDNACWGGKIFMTSYQKKLERLLTLAAEERIALVIMEPALINHIALHYPEVNFIIAASSSHGLFDFHLRCRYHEKYFNQNGSLKRIIIPSDLNRDFAAIREIRNACECSVAVKVNEGDIFCTPFKLSEETSLSHINPYRDYEYYRMVKETFLTLRKELFLKDPWRLIASPWVRPEDLGYYEALGIDCFTIMVNEGSNISGLAKAYGNQKYEGNIISLLKEGDKFEKDIFLDNRWFDGFVDELEAGKGCIRDCEKCMICIEMGERWNYEAHEETRSQGKRNSKIGN